MTANWTLISLRLLDTIFVSANNIIVYAQRTLVLAGGKMAQIAAGLLAILACPV
jgi:hypothetical protein